MQKVLDVLRITTELVSAADPTATPGLQTGRGSPSRFTSPVIIIYRFVDVRKELAAAGNDYRRLAELGQECGIQVGYHNHDGCIGAPV